MVQKVAKTNAVPLFRPAQYIQLYYYSYLVRGARLRIDTG
jgi:hypothetical protein